MADDVYGNYTRVNTKGRSASICAPGSSSMETLIQQQLILQQTGQQSVPGSGHGTPTKRQTPEPGTPPPTTTTGNRRRGKPAARSQSARITSSRSVRRKTTTQTTIINNNHHSSTTHHEIMTSNMKRDGGSHYNSEPRLSETPEPSPGIRRRGSRRGVSVYQHRKSTAFLDVPDSRNTHGSRSDDGSNADQDEDPDSYRLRSFSSTSKGIVNRGDSFRRRRSRSSSLCPGHHALPLSTLDRDTPPRSPGGIHTTVVTEEDTTQISRSNTNLSNHTLNNRRTSSEDHGDTHVHEEDEETRCYHVALIGAPGVGKTALISQFMTSECINAYDRQKEISEEQTVSIMLNGEESELHFINIQSPKDIDKATPPDAFVVIYSVVDRASYTRAENELRSMHDAGLLRGKPLLVVANKIDLARSRGVTSQDGKCLACTYRAKYIEVSVGINHNVDELLVGILSQIRLKEAQGGGISGHHGPGSGQQWYKSRGVVRASMKARQMFTWIFGKEDTKFKNCENLHIL